MQPPPFTITPEILHLVATIGEQVGRLEANLPPERQVLLRRGNRIRTVQGSLAIEGNTLSVEQVTAVVAGKRVLGSAREVQEVCGAIAAYERLDELDPTNSDDLLAAYNSNRQAGSARMSTRHSSLRSCPMSRHLETHP